MTAGIFFRKPLQSALLQPNRFSHSNKWEDLRYRCNIGFGLKCSLKGGEMGIVISGIITSLQLVGDVRRPKP